MAGIPLMTIIGPVLTFNLHQSAFPGHRHIKESPGNENRNDIITFTESSHPQITLIKWLAKLLVTVLELFSDLAKNYC